MNSKMTKAVGYSLAACALACSVTLVGNANSALSGVSAISSTTGAIDWHAVYTKCAPKKENC